MAKRSAVKCKKCGAKGYNDTAYRYITPNNNKFYFCDENCFNQFNNKDLRLTEIEYFLIDIFNNHLNKATKTFIFKTVYEYRDANMLESLHFILQKKSGSIKQFLNTKEFNNPIGKAKYLLKMIEEDVKGEHKQRQHIQAVQAIEKDIEIVEDKREEIKPKRVRGISEFL